MSEQVLGWCPLGLGLVVEDEPSELSCIHNVYIYIYHSEAYSHRSVTELAELYLN